MTSPNEQTEVCPACHKPITLNRTTGAFQQHLVTDLSVYPAVRGICRMSGQRPIPARFGDGSLFESCPAATGEPVADDSSKRCAQFPDGAHRCGLARTHMADSWKAADMTMGSHKCTCGYTWFSGEGDMPSFIAALTRPHDGKAVELLKYAYNLRVNGEHAPGGEETWQQFDTEVDAHLRSLGCQHVWRETEERDALGNHLYKCQRCGEHE